MVDDLGCKTRNTQHSSTHRSPSEILLNRQLRGVIDNLKPSITHSIIESADRQKLYYDRNKNLREFNVNVWIQNELNPGFRKGIIKKRTGELSYNVEVDGKTKRKHADNLKFRFENNQSTNDQRTTENNPSRDITQNSSFEQSTSQHVQESGHQIKQHVSLTPGILEGRENHQLTLTTREDDIVLDISRRDAKDTP
ncbi:hypothetical protein RF11_07054 [Thelohanellus kitauei]|uniref:Uncharacterized protein n=1 Tax=Thelohanellus kitauei TaxID=669202 RepID=A0A0C2J3M3_THEKT|nr:hypothetical protein RF11_07054 [Thelohanellus kitauei]